MSEKDPQISAGKVECQVLEERFGSRRRSFPQTDGVFETFACQEATGFSPTLPPS